MFKLLSIALIVLGLSSPNAHAAKIGCIALGPLSLQAAILVRAAKAAKVINSKKECYEQTSTVALVAQTLTGGNEALAAILSGVFVRCGCILAF